MISPLEGEDCFLYHLLHHLGDGNALAVWLGGHPEGESMLAESFVNDLHQMQYAFALLYHLHCSARSFRYTRIFILTALLGAYGLRRE